MGKEGITPVSGLSSKHWYYKNKQNKHNTTTVKFIKTVIMSQFNISFVLFLPFVYLKFSKNNGLAPNFMKFQVTILYLVLAWGIVVWEDSSQSVI
jgi:hypothetical protein